MDHERLAAMSLLLGLEAAIEHLTGQRDEILTNLGMNGRPRVKRIKEPPLTVDIVSTTDHATPAPKKRHKRVKCSICGASFKRVQGLSSHMRSHDREHKKSTIRCVHCERPPFKTKSGLSAHMRSKHPDELTKETVAA